MKHRRSKRLLLLSKYRRQNPLPIKIHMKMIMISNSSQLQRLNHSDNHSSTINNLPGRPNTPTGPRTQSKPVPKSTINPSNSKMKTLMKMTDRILKSRTMTKERISKRPYRSQRIKCWTLPSKFSRSSLTVLRPSM